MERFIAIDNVCAWPNLTLMPEGTIIATIFNQPTHNGDLVVIALVLKLSGVRILLVYGRHTPGGSTTYAPA